jgi:hypothetical protein
MDDTTSDILDQTDEGILTPTQNLVDKIGGAPILVGDAWSIGHQTSGFDILPETVHRRQSRAQRQGVDANPGWCSGAGRGGGSTALDLLSFFEIERGWRFGTSLAIQAARDRCVGV